MTALAKIGHGLATGLRAARPHVFAAVACAILVGGAVMNLAWAYRHVVRGPMMPRFPQWPGPDRAPIEGGFGYPTALPHSPLKIGKAASTNGPVHVHRGSDAKRLRIGGRVYELALGGRLHQRIELLLPEGASSLSGHYGVHEDEVIPPEGPPVYFRIAARGRVIYDSPAMYPGDGALPFKIDVTGLSSVDLLVEGDNDFEGLFASPHAAWLDLRAL